MISPGDKVVSIVPTYQQLYSIPASFGANMAILHLTKEEEYLPNLEKLKALVTPDTKMICINNPDNPTGVLMSKEVLMEIVEIARSVGTYVLCDETYRHLTQNDEWCESIADLYEKGISVSSMSKVFSLAGLRQGWIASRDPALRSVFLLHRDYTLVSCGVFDKMVSALALKHSDVILERNRAIVRENLAILDDFLLHRDYTLVSCGVFDKMVSALALKHSDVILERNRAIVRENLAILDEWIQKQPHLHYIKPQAGTTALVDYDFDMSSIEFCDKLYHQTGAFVVPGDCFEQPKSMRIGYAYNKQELIGGLAAFDQFLKTLE